VIGAGTFINPLLKIVTVFAILGASYLFIVKPALDTTEDISSEIGNSIGQSLESTNDQIDNALEQAGPGSATIEIPQSSQDSLKEANKLLNCIQRANGNVDKIQRCNQ
jgi:flavin-binding protein dodecin